MISLILQKAKDIISFLNRSDGSLKKKVIRSGMWVTVSSVVIQSLTFIRTIILARLLTPEIFGLIGLCMIVIRGIELFSQTGFTAALIYRQKGFEEAKDTAYTLMIIRGFVLAIICFFISPYMASYYEKDVLDIIIKIVAISFIFKGFHNINIIAHEKELDFKRITYFQQATALLNTISVIILAYYLRNVWALVYSQVITSFIAFIMSFLIIPGRPRMRFDKEIAKELFSYGKYITGITVVLYIATEVDKALIGKIMGTEALGFYVLPFTLANLPATHISKLVSNIMFPVYSKLQNDFKALRNTYLEVLKLVSTFAFPIAVGIATLAPEIVRHVYGDKWMPAVSVLQVLCIFGALRSIVAINGYLFNGIGKPNVPFYFGVLRLSLIVVLIYPLIISYGVEGAAIAICIPLLIENILGAIVLIRVIGLKTVNILKTISISLGCSLIMAVNIILVRSNISNINIKGLIFLILIGMFTIGILNYRYIISSYKKLAS